MQTIADRIAGIRKLMKKYGLAAYFIPSTDDHQNEYIPDFWKRRQWISGFHGSAGDIVILADRASLWTDSRYFLQAESELTGSGIELLKAGFIDFRSIYDWTVHELKPGTTVGIDPKLIPIEEATGLIKKMMSKKIKVKFIEKNLVDIIWNDKPQPKTNTVEIHPLKYCGENFSSKLKRLREKLADENCFCHIISSLDSVAWLFNIRGQDIEYNPLVISYAAITADKAFIFIGIDKVNENLLRHFESKVEIKPYSDFRNFCKQLSTKKIKVWIDNQRTSYWIYSLLNHGCDIYLNESPVYYFKSIKNETELASISRSMQADGLALVKFFYWLTTEVKKGNITEESAAIKLEEYRKENPEYKRPSFYTISAFNEHGAIIHYAYRKDSSATIKVPGIYLVDSGAHYPGGTTDITRTISLGNPTTEQASNYTKVLKGHINLAIAVFPKGTKGIQLDILARKALWDSGLDYGHGTGHGIGFYLNVHEGPQSISPSKLSSPGLEPGMLISDEPGYYKENEYGIRIENILLVDRCSEFIDTEVPFYRFQILSLCPFDRNLIDISLLSIEEKYLVNAYHKEVYNKLSPYIAEKGLKKWFEDATAPL